MATQTLQLNRRELWSFTSALFDLRGASWRDGLPTISVWDRFVRAGGLISYGTNEAANYRLVGNYAGRILRGEKPADIPVQQPTRTKSAT